MEEARSRAQTPHEEEPLPWRERVGWLDVLLVFVVYFVLSIIVGVVIAVLGYDLESINGQLLVLAAGALASILGVGAVVAARRRLSGASIGLKGTSGRWLMIGLGASLLGWLINRGVALLYILVSGDTSNPQAGLVSTAQGTISQFVLSIVLASLLVPFGEELLFRGVFYTWLRRWGLVVAVVVSALVFGLFHVINGFNLALLISTIVIGVLTALLYERSGSLWPGMMAHGLNNLLIFVTIRLLL